MSEFIDPVEQVITDAVNDSVNDVPEEVVDDTTVEASETAPEAPTDDAPAEPVAEEPSLEVTSPAASQSPTEAKQQQPKDDFERLAGVPQNGVGGRENRIPYSRVKKITEKAVSEVVEAVVGRKLNAGEKAVDVVKQHVARIPELEAENTDYRQRLDVVGQFEQMMEHQPEVFLEKLATLPAYKEFFDFVRNAVATSQGQPQQQAAQQPTQEFYAADGMPEPNEELPDGTKVYNMEGLQKLLAWNAKQVEDRVTRQIQDRYKPIESEWQERRRIEATLPIVRAKIAEAKQWPLFNESEAEITALLERNPTMSLEEAYRHVAFPKIIADRNKIRQEVIQEVRRAPASTAVSARPVKPGPASTGPRSIEDIIKEQVETLKR